MNNNKIYNTAAEIQQGNVQLQPQQYDAAENGAAK